MSSQSTSNKRKRSTEPDESLANPRVQSQEPIPEIVDQVDKTEEPTTNTTTSTTDSDEPLAKQAKQTPNDDSPDSDVEEGQVTDDEGPPPLPTEQPPSSTTSAQPPLPSEPLPTGLLPPTIDDGWEPIWDSSAQSYYFYNRFTQKSQWDNPRLVPNTTTTSTTTNATAQPDSTPTPGAAGRYNPAIHGDYDPTADYAQLPLPDPTSSLLDPSSSSSSIPSSDPAAYAATATFNRFTGRFQTGLLAPENFNDENKSKRQMNAFFDVDQAANSHGGKSLKAERQNQKLSKKELMELKSKQKKRKETKQRAWLMD